MRPHLYLLLLFVTPFAFAQQAQPKLGAQLTATHLNGGPGLVPMATVDYRGHQLSAGPYLLFEYPSKIKEPPGYTNNHFTFGASYRYFPVKQWEKLRPFAALSMFYGINYSAMDRDYDAYFQSGNNPIFYHSFAGRVENRSRWLDVYTGLGLEADPWEHVYFAASGNFGPSFYRSHQTIRNRDTGVTEYDSEQDWRHDRWGWMANVSCGYRF